MRKLCKKIVLAAPLILACGQAAYAREFADIYTECGLGAMIAPKNSTVAAITNVTFDLGTTAISSNTLSPETCKGGKARTAMFIHDSYDSLESEIAMGHGEYLDTLVKMGDIKSKDALRQNFAKVIAQPGYNQLSRKEKSEALYNLVYPQA